MSHLSHQLYCIYQDIVLFLGVLYPEFDPLIYDWAPLVVQTSQSTAVNQCDNGTGLWETTLFHWCKSGWWLCSFDRKLRVVFESILDECQNHHFSFLCHHLHQRTVHTIQRCPQLIFWWEIHVKLSPYQSSLFAGSCIKCNQLLPNQKYIFWISNLSLNHEW